MKILIQICLFSAGLFLLSCKKPPEYPAVPEISDLKLTKVTVLKKESDGLEYYEDSVTISVYFKDGDGDLGFTGAGEPNFYADVFLKKGDEFVSIYDTVRDNSTGKITSINKINKNGTFFPLNTDGRQGPIEGTLNYGVSLSLLIINADEYTLKFRVRIRDNQGNLSNTLETPEVLIRYYQNSNASPI